MLTGGERAWFSSCAVDTNFSRPTLSCFSPLAIFLFCSSALLRRTLRSDLQTFSTPGNLPEFSEAQRFFVPILKWFRRKLLILRFYLLVSDYFESVPPICSLVV